MGRISLPPSIRGIFGRMKQGSEVSAVIRANRAAYRAEYARIALDAAWNWKAMSLLGILIAFNAVTNYIKHDDPRFFLAHALTFFSYASLRFYRPSEGPFGFAWRSAFVPMGLAAAWAWQSTLTLGPGFPHQNSPSMVYFLIVVIWMANFSPSAWQRMLVGLSASLFYIISVKNAADHQYSWTIFRSCSTPLGIGITMNLIIQKLMQYRFWSELTEKNIKESHRLLEVKKEEIETVFHAVDFAMFKLYEKSHGLIVIARVRSEATDRMFALNPNAYDIDFKEAVLSKSDLPEFLQLDLIRRLSEILNAERISFDAQEVGLPQELRLAAASGNRYLVVDWKALRHEKENRVDTILVTIKDITESREIEKDRDLQREKNNCLIELHKAQKPLSLAFIRSAGSLLADARKVAERPLGMNEIKDIFRFVHTIKGNSNYPGLRMVTASAHAFENILAEKIRRPELELSGDYVRAELEKIGRSIGFYERVMQELSWFDELGSGFTLDAADLNQLVMNYPGGPEALFVQFDQNTSMAGLLEEVFPSVKSLATRIHESAEMLAFELDKPLPSLEFQGLRMHVRAEFAPVLQAALSHLMNNSLDHGIEATSLRKRLGKDERGRISISCHKTTDRAQIHWRDDGRGLDLQAIRAKAIRMGYPQFDEKKDIEIANLIFESGFSTKEKASNVSGRGIGLAAIATTLKDMGGTIEIRLEGVSAQGSQELSFCISFPIAHALTIGADSEIPPGRPKLDILLVDDDMISRSTLARAIKKEGFSLAVASSAAEALQWISRHDFEAVLCDIQMPDVDGFETCRLIRENCLESAWPRARIIGLSASLREEYPQRQAEVGMDALEIKSLDLTWLRSLRRKEKAS